MLFISRCLLHLLFILSLAASVPQFFKHIFSEAYETALIAYSPVKKSVILRSYRNGQWFYSKADGEPLTEEELHHALPLHYMHTLERRGMLPEELEGWNFDYEQALRYISKERLSPSQLDKPRFALFALMDSTPTVSGFEFPTELFRVRDHRIEFIDSASNQINVEKSARFTKRLKQAGFVYPPRMIADSPSQRKFFDNGVMMVDKEGQVFHIKRAGERFFITRTNTTLPDTALALKVLEQPRREHHALVILEGGLLLIDRNDYTPITVPLSDYQARQDNLSIDGNYLHWEFTQYSAKNDERVFLLAARDMTTKLRYTWRKESSTAVRDVFSAFFFPYQLDFKVDERSQYGLYLRSADGPLWMSLGGVVAALLFYVVLCRLYLRRSQHAVDVVLILLGGFYAVISLLCLSSLGQFKTVAKGLK